MGAIQLQFDFGDEDSKLAMMDSKIKAISDSTGKVRRSLFAQMDEVKKLMIELKIENLALKQAIESLIIHKTPQS